MAKITKKTGVPRSTRGGCRRQRQVVIEYQVYSINYRRKKTRRRRHCRGAHTGRAAEARLRARSRRRGWTAAHCSRSLPSGVTAARCRRRGVCRPRGAHMSPRRCGSRGERLDGGDARTGAVARGWTSGSMRPRILPFHSRARNGRGTSAQNTLSNTWFRFCSIATTF